MQQGSSNRLFSIQPELLRLLFAQAPPSFVASIIGTVVLAFVLWDVVNHTSLAIWLLLMIAINSMRFLLVYRFKQSESFQTQKPHWHLYFILLTLGIGAVWGVGAVLFMQQVELPYQVFIALMIVGMTAGAIASYTPSILAYTAFILPVMLPSGFWLLFQDSKIDLAMGIMGLLFALVMWLIARQQHHTLIENMGLRSEKENLFKQLQESKERHEKAQLLAHMGHWELNLSTGNMLWSDEVYHIFEIDPNQKNATYELFLKSIHPDEREQVNATYQMSLKNQQPYEIEYRLLFSDGRIKWVHEQSESELDADGATLRSVGTVQDISERIAIEQERISLQAQMEHSQRLDSLGILAGGIAHDFNNILTTILGNAAMAERKALTQPEDLPKHLHNIVASSEKAAELCKQMLAYSGKGEFIIQSINLSDLVKSVSKLLEISIGKGVALKYHMMEELPAVDVDLAQMQQVIMNLVINASDAIEEKNGIITIGTGLIELDHAYLLSINLNDELPEGPYVFLEVSDTGCGMDKETQQRIFEPFFSTKVSGHGLGMSAVAGIVRGHRGAIKLYSEAGKGSTFKLLLPVSDAKAELIEHKATALSPWQGSGTILIIDDEESIRETVAMMLEDLGFASLAAVDGEDGVELYRQHQQEIVAVLLDMTMPKLDGKGCFRELRRINKNVQVILSSGYNEKEATSRFTGKGLAGFVQKPYRPEILETAIRNILE